MTSTERRLSWLLRLVGLSMVLALPAVVMPFSWSEAAHRGAGLGELPWSPVVEYLVRSVSAKYFMMGVLLIYLGGDVRRHAGVISVVGWLWALFGIPMVVLDARAGLPLWWVLNEGPWLLVAGAAFVLLARRVRVQSFSTASRP